MGAFFYFLPGEVVAHLRLGGAAALEAELQRLVGRVGAPTKQACQWSPLSNCGKPRPPLLRESQRPPSLSHANRRSHLVQPCKAPSWPDFLLQGCSSLRPGEGRWSR